MLALAGMWEELPFLGILFLFHSLTTKLMGRKGRLGCQVLLGRALVLRDQGRLREARNVPGIEEVPTWPTHPSSRPKEIHCGRFSGTGQAASNVRMVRSLAAG